MAPDPASRPGLPADLRIEIAEEAGNWSDVGVAERIDAVVKALTARVGDAEGTVALALADDAMVRDLNRRFRGKDKPTNVLSFPSGETGGADTHIGDVILAIETLRREADADGKPVGDHFAHLVIHGILHLMGYDHESDDDAECMECLETAILADLGIDDPYAEPAIADSEPR